MIYYVLVKKEGSLTEVQSMNAWNRVTDLRGEGRRGWEEINQNLYA